MVTRISQCTLAWFFFIITAFALLHRTIKRRWHARTLLCWPRGGYSLKILTAEKLTSNYDVCLIWLRRASLLLRRRCRCRRLALSDRVRLDAVITPINSELRPRRSASRRCHFNWKPQRSRLQCRLSVNQTAELAAWALRYTNNL